LGKVVQVERLGLEVLAELKDQILFYLHRLLVRLLHILLRQKVVGTELYLVLLRKVERVVQEVVGGVVEQVVQLQQLHQVKETQVVEVTGLLLITQEVAVVVLDLAVLEVLAHQQQEEMVVQVF
jgi:hypothetical protein